MSWLILLVGVVVIVAMGYSFLAQVLALILQVLPKAINKEDYEWSISLRGFMFCTVAGIMAIAYSLYLNQWSF